MQNNNGNVYNGDGLTLTLVCGKQSCSFVMSSEVIGRTQDHLLSPILLNAVRDMLAKIKGE